MPLIARFQFASMEPLPGKLYVHSLGLKEVFFDNSQKARIYFSQEVIPHLFGSYFIDGGSFKPEYFIAMVWGNQRTYRARADVFLAGEFAPFRNSTILPILFNGPQPTTPPYLCG